MHRLSTFKQVGNDFSGNHLKEKAAELAKRRSEEPFGSSSSSIVYGPDAMFGKGASSSVVVRVEGDSGSDVDSMTEVKVVEPNSGSQNRSRLGSMRSTGSSSLRKKLSSRL